MPRNVGDCVVILFIDPGPNLLAHYFPPLKVNDFLLSEVDWSHQGAADDLSPLPVKELNTHKMRKNSTMIYMMELFYMSKNWIPKT